MKKILRIIVRTTMVVTISLSIISCGKSQKNRTSGQELGNDDDRTSGIISSGGLLIGDPAIVSVELSLEECLAASLSNSGDDFDALNDASLSCWQSSWGSLSVAICSDDALSLKYAEICNTQGEIEICSDEMDAFLTAIDQNEKTSFLCFNECECDAEIESVDQFNTCYDSCLDEDEEEIGETGDFLSQSADDILYTSIYKMGDQSDEDSDALLFASADVYLFDEDLYGVVDECDEGLDCSVAGTIVTGIGVETHGLQESTRDIVCIHLRVRPILEDGSAGEPHYIRRSIKETGYQGAFGNKCTGDVDDYRYTFAGGSREAGPETFVELADPTAEKMQALTGIAVRAGQNTDNTNAQLGEIKVYRRRILEAGAEGRFLGTEDIIQYQKVNENEKYQGLDVDIDTEFIQDVMDTENFGSEHREFIIVGIGFEGKRDGKGMHLDITAQARTLYVTETAEEDAEEESSALAGEE